MKHLSHHRSSGFSLVELAIAFTVLSLIIGSIGMVSLAGKDAYQEGLKAATLESRARQALERVASELTAGVQSTLTPSPSGPVAVSAVRFQTCQGFAAGAQILSNPTIARLESDPNDPDDGLDNDNDGYVDERQLVLVRDAGLPEELRTVLCSNVAELLAGETANMADDNGNGLIDESGFCISADGQGTLRMRLTVQARDQRNNLVSRTVETSVHMRN